MPPPTRKQPTARAVVRDVRDDDPLLLVFTSGTQGAAKGALLTHTNCFWTNLSLSRTAELTSRDVVLSVLPQFHAGGWNIQPLLAWWVGATVVLERTFEPDRVLQLIAERRVTTLMGVPTNYLMLAEHPEFENADLSSLRSAVVGGAPMPEPLLRTWHRRGVGLVQGYGLTEAGPNVLCLPDDEARARSGLAGKPYPHVEVAVADPVTGELLDGAARGELLVRGPGVFAGYFRDPDATARALAGGWLHTGDLVERDTDGYFRIVDRLKDIFIVGGENVSPAEVEAVLGPAPRSRRGGRCRHPGRAVGRGGRRVRRPSGGRAHRRRRARRPVPPRARALQGAAALRVRDPAAAHLAAQGAPADAGQSGHPARPRTGGPTMSAAPRTAKGNRTRAKILEAAEQVFAEVGYHEASIVKITEAAGVGLGTFYLYFDGKQAVFDEVVEDLNRRVRHTMYEASSAAPNRLEAERAGFRAFFRFTAEHPALYRIIRQAEFVSPEALKLHYTRIVEGYAAGLAKAQVDGEVGDIDPTVAAWALMGIGEIVGMRWVLWPEGGGEVPPEVFDEAMKFIQRALSPSVQASNEEPTQ